MHGICAFCERRIYFESHRLRCKHTSINNGDTINIMDKPGFSPHGGGSSDDGEGGGGGFGGRDGGVGRDDEGGKTVVIEPHRHEGVFIASGKKDALVNFGKIYLTLLNGTGYVFDVHDYMELRTRYHILGSFVGSMPAHAGTGLPVELTKLETRLLVENGIAQLVSKTASLLRTPSHKESEAYKKAAEQRLLEQADALKADKLRNAELNMDNILAGKRRKLNLAGKPTDELTHEKILQEIDEQFVFDKDNAFVEVPYAHPEEHEGRIVQLPSLSPYETTKYRVFKEFWQIGKYVTPGDAFGGEFLLYPGDPVRYHASHVVFVVDRPTEFELSTLVNLVRTTVVVNKICVIAYTTGDDIKFQTILWDRTDEGITETLVMHSTAEDSPADETLTE